MFNRKVYDALADDPGLLANKLHKRYVYESPLEKQIKIAELINSIIKRYSDEKFLKLGFNKDTKNLIKEVIACKNEPNWNKIILKFLKGMKSLLEREISRAHKTRKPKNILLLIKKELKKLHIYEKGDVIEVEESNFNILHVNYVSIQNSPKYDGKFKSWRDTQFQSTLYFDKGLFVWDYINIQDALRNKGMGTKLIVFCERFAKDLGFKRFSVEWPNRLYWSKKHNYEIPMKYKIGSSKKMPYTHEGYKEVN